MAMMWGVVPIKAKYNAEVEQLFDWFASEAVKSGLVEEGSKLVVTELKMQYSRHMTKFRNAKTQPLNTKHKL